ncbi:MAG: alpha/beta fold hydrolase, partial [Armatimonadota bacterium]|nr:alpha/beta fold hydrolase [Armatimonadota bacterium]
ALLFEPPGARGPLVIYVNGAGKAPDAEPGGPIEVLTAAGHRVLALDVRGTGETSPGAPTNTQTAFKEAFLAIHLNRPLLGQRVFDILSVVGWAANYAGDTPLHLIGVGSSGPIALHAAAFAPRLTRVTLRRTLVSWRNVLQSPFHRDQLANAVPGALEVYDLPDLARSLAPRELTLAAPVDARGEPVPLAVAEESYATCRAAYVALGAGERFRVSAE